MGLALLSILTAVTSPWFLILTSGQFEKGFFYTPEVGVVIDNFFKVLSFDFLVFRGDELIKNSIPEAGNFYLWQLPFILLGFYSFVLGRKRKYYLGFFLITAFFSCFFKPAPNLVFSTPFLLVISLTIGKGMVFAVGLIKEGKKAVVLFLAAVYFLFAVYNTFFTLHQYQVHYPKKIERLNE